MEMAGDNNNNDDDGNCISEISKQLLLELCTCKPNY